MAITYVNTIEVEEIAKELISISNEYVTEINNLFSRLAEVPHETKEWTGTQSKKFHNIVSRDKKSFLEVGKQLKYIGEKISNDASEISGAVSATNSAEGKKGY